MSIARYTQKIMNDLQRDGRTVVIASGWLTESAARSRIYNAAARLGVKVITYKDGNGIIRGMVSNLDLEDSQS